MKLFLFVVDSDSAIYTCASRLDTPYYGKNVSVTLDKLLLQRKKPNTHIVLHIQHN